MNILLSFLKFSESPEAKYFFVCSPPIFEPWTAEK